MTNAKIILTAVVAPKFIGGMLVAGTLLAAATVPFPAIGAEGEDGSLVWTRDGSVRGFVDNGVREFLGIPYAAPPIGQLRWMPPQPDHEGD